MAAERNTWFRENFAISITEKCDGSVVVVLAGEFDLSTAPDLRDALASPRVLEAKAVQVDLEKATFFDSSSISVLVTACKHVRNSGGTFSASFGTGLVRRVFEIAGLIEYLQAAEH